MPLSTISRQAIILTPDEKRMVLDYMRARRLAVVSSVSASGAPQCGQPSGHCVTAGAGPHIYLDWIARSSMSPLARIDAEDGLIRLASFDSGLWRKNPQVRPRICRRLAAYRGGGGGRSAGGVRSNRCSPVAGSTARSTVTQPFTSYAS